MRLSKGATTAKLHRAEDKDLETSIDREAVIKAFREKYLIGDGLLAGMQSPIDVFGSAATIEIGDMSAEAAFDRVANRINAAAKRVLGDLAGN